MKFLVVSVAKRKDQACTLTNGTNGITQDVRFVYFRESSMACHLTLLLSHARPQSIFSNENYCRRHRCRRRRCSMTSRTRTSGHRQTVELVPRPTWLFSSLLSISTCLCLETLRPRSRAVCQLRSANFTLFVVTRDFRQSSSRYINPTWYFDFPKSF